ncbi:Vacuolar protein sorting-associated protein 37A [Mortierella alpina]|nr:Vacuolar protein sorting-associated protein 37A [Mortierella alpina]
MERLLNSASWGRKSNNDHDSSQRRKQIESLLTEIPQLRVVPNDDSRFQLTLQLANNPDSPLSTSAPHLLRKTSSPALNNRTLSHDSPGSATGALGGAGGGGAASTATLTVYLPPAFPEEEPKITIQPAVRHLWVDGTVSPCAVTGHERLAPGGWSAHASLGKIVKEIVSNIQRSGVLVGGEGADLHGSNGTMGSSSNNSRPAIGANDHKNGFSSNSAGYDEYSHKPPPPIPGIRTKSLGHGINGQGSPSFTNTNGTQYRHPAAAGAGAGAGASSSTANNASSSTTGEGMSNQQAQIRANVQGAYNNNLSPEARIVMELSAEKLEELLESPIAFEHFVDHLDIVVNSRTLKREWWLGNDNVSRRNLALEEEMLELQKSTAEGHKVAMELQKSLEEKLQQQQDALWRFKPETLQSKLRAAAAESDELSESVGHSFLEGKLDQEGFIRQYRELRKVYHLREMKNERIGSILRNHPSINATSSGSSMTGGAGQDGSISKSKLGMGSGSGSSAGALGGTSGPGGPGTSDAWVML